VLEDAADVILNLKEVRLRGERSAPEISISKQARGVTAGDSRRATRRRDPQLTSIADAVGGLNLTAPCNVRAPCDRPEERAEDRDLARDR
jgi:hypothetical protein